MMENVKRQLSSKEKRIVGGVCYAIKVGKYYYFPLSGIMMKRKDKKPDKKR